jgi:two-component system, chemotaxis family, sensor kinase CheA
MNKAALIESLMSTFVEEVAEHVGSFNRDLLALESGQGDRAGLLQSLLRTAHNLKGAARAVDVDLVESACHRLEDILARARDGVRPLDAEAFALLFATADAIQDAGVRLKEKQSLSASPLAVLTSRPIPAEPPAVSGQWPDEPPAAPPPAGATPAVSGTATAATPEPERREGDTLRVSANKLDSVLVRSGELLLAVRQTEHRRDEWTVLAEAADGLAADFSHLQTLLAPGPGTETRTAVAQVAAGVARLREGIERAVSDAASGGRGLIRTAGDLDSRVRSLRMVPFGEAGQGLERVARDLALAAGKEVVFKLVGHEVELDRAVAERLKDPLLHLVRNAVDHGIEPPAERVAAGKPLAGTITVSASLKGAQVEISIADDGRGLDRKRIREEARARGLPESADDRDLLALVFHPGLSTARTLTSVSGRGVGLDVVKSQVNALHGTVGLETIEGAGTTFALTVPLTVTLIRALLVEAAGRTFAVATTQVMSVRKLIVPEVRNVGGREMLATMHGLLPLVSLAEAIGLPAPRRDLGQGCFVVLMDAGTSRVAFVVDELLDEQDLVVTGLGRRLRRVPNVAGCALLEDGGIALILSAAELAESALLSPGQRLVLPISGPETVRKRILVADDSVTTRTLEKTLLEEAGYLVRLAADGHQAWRILQEDTIDLLVADVEMPGMDGFTLTDTLRHSPSPRRIPVVLVTSLSSDKDRARGLEVGADAYLVKSGFDRSTLLEAVGQLL